MKWYNSLKKSKYCPGNGRYDTEHILGDLCFYCMCTGLFLLHISGAIVYLFLPNPEWQTMLLMGFIILDGIPPAPFFFMTIFGFYTTAVLSLVVWDLFLIKLGVSYPVDNIYDRRAERRKLKEYKKLELYKYPEEDREYQKWKMEIEAVCGTSDDYLLRAKN